MTKRFRHVAVYYRDADRVWRRIPGVTLFIDNGVLVDMYTQNDVRINLEDD